MTILQNLYSATNVYQNFIFPSGIDTGLSSRRDRHREWSAITKEISEWISDPSIIANEDGQSPSRMTIRRALHLATELIDDQKTSAPTAVVPDGNGGITFEWRFGPTSRWIEISPAGRIEEIIIRNGQLRSRNELVLNDFIEI